MVSCGDESSLAWHVVMERCWHGRFTRTGQCPELGRYGNPEYRPDGCRPRLNCSVKFVRASRWCLAHKQPGDRLLAPDGDALESAEGGPPPENSLAP